MKTSTGVNRRSSGETRRTIDVDTGAAEAIFDALMDLHYRLDTAARALKTSSTQEETRGPQIVVEDAMWKLSDVSGRIHDILEGGRDGR